MPEIFDSKESVFFVGGPISHIGILNAAGVTKDQWLIDPDMSKYMTVNGGAIGSTTDAPISDNGGNVRLGGEAGEFDDVIEGTNCNCVFDAVYTNGIYEILSVDTVNDDITIDLTYSAGANATVYIGGAFDTLQNAADLTDAANYNVFICTNKDETYAATLDFDTGLGSVANNTRKDVIFFNTTPPTNAEMKNGDMDVGGAYYESALTTYINGGTPTAGKKGVIDNTGGAFDLIAIGTGINLHFRNAHFKQTDNTYDAIRFDSGSSKGCAFEGCAITGHYKIIDGSAGLKTDIVDCYIGPGNYTYQWFGTLQNGLIDRCVIEQGSTQDGVYCFYTTLKGCLIVGGRYGVQLRETNILGCILYNQTVAAIYTTSPDDGIAKVENSILFLADKSDRALYKYNNGSFSKFDNNCYFAIEDAGDGIPCALTNPFWDNGASVAFIPNGSGNISQDPLFADVANGDFRLLPKSPCLNTGKQTLDDGFTSMGAWQQKQRGSMIGAMNV